MFEIGLINKAEALYRISKNLGNFVLDRITVGSSKEAYDENYKGRVTYLLQDEPPVEDTKIEYGQDDSPNESESYLNINLS
ncbi:MAG TPA: hypothetical protein VLF63_02210 [Patescibacteria group bacterium]|nr:hypothetical protein [Patescibacteria group bacterium]